MSHRFSTVSIGSNVSSDVSFGNASAVSGSSCYLASMSSADFDDARDMPTGGGLCHTTLASSLSMSEADEGEYLAAVAAAEAAAAANPAEYQSPPVITVVPEVSCALM